MKTYISQRALNTPPSPIRSLSAYATMARTRGIEPYCLNIGQPDLLCPDSYVEGVLKYSKGYVPYTPGDGLLELKEAWCDWINREHGTRTQMVDYIITQGASEGLVFVFTACADPGDEILTFDPTYANYLGFAAQTGVRLVALQTNLEDGFKLPDRDILKKHLTSRTRAILLCNPNNPTGILYSTKEVIALLKFCQDYNLHLILDETYREIVFDGVQPSTALHSAPNNRNVVVIDSLSKRFSLCGSRIGSLYVPDPKLRKQIVHLAQSRLSAPYLEQAAAAHMLNNIDPNHLNIVRQTYQSRRDCMLDSLKQIPNIKYTKPQATFYTLVELPVDNAEEFAKFLLEKHQVNGRTLFVAPANGFYSVSGPGNKQIRLAFVLNEKDIRSAIEVLSTGLLKFGN